MLTGEELEAWKRKRRATMIVTAIHRILFGIQYSNVFSTLWIYLTTLVETDRPYLWYSLISVSFHVSGMILTLVIGRISDRTRDIRACFLVTTALTIVGNVLYSLPFSIYYVFAGRFISGSIVATRPLVTGEVVRVYEEADVLRMLSLTGMCFGLGLTVGPAMNFAFVNFDITIGGLHLTYANAPSLFLSVVFTIQEILMIFFLHNLSKEYDLKAERASANAELQQSTSIVVSDNPNASGKFITDIHNFSGHFVSSIGSITSLRSTRSIGDNYILEHRSRADSQQSKVRTTSISCSFNTGLSLSIERDLGKLDPNVYGINHSQQLSTRETAMLKEANNQARSMDNEKTPLLVQNEVPSIMKVLHRIFVNFDSVFIICCSCLLTSIYNSSDLWTPLIVTEILKWGVIELNSIFLVSGIFSIIMTFLIAAIRMSANTYYKLNLCAIIGLILIEGIFMILKLHHKSLYLNIALYSVYSILFGITFSFEDAYLSNVLAQMLPSSVQGLGESIRLTFIRFGNILTLFTGGLVFNWIEFVTGGIAACLLLQLIVMVIRKKNINSPKYIM